MRLRSDFLETARHAVVFGLGSVGSSLVAFLLLPVFTAYLTPAQYGTLALLTLAGALGAVLLRMGLSTSIFRHYYGSGNAQEERRVIGTALIWLAGSGALALALAWPAAPAVSRLLFSDAAYAPHCRLVLATAVLTSVQTVPFALLRARKQSRRYALFSLAQVVVGALSAVWLVVGAGQGLYGILLARLLTAALFTAWGVWLCRDGISWGFSWPVARGLLGYGLPLIPSAVSSLVLSQLDRYLLQGLAGLEAVGLYALGYQVGAVVNLLLVQPFQLVWFPKIFEMDKRPEGRAFFERMLTFFVVGAAWVALGLSLLGEELIALMAAPQYREAHRVIPWVAFAYVAYGAHMVSNISIYLRDRSYYTAWMVGGSGALNVGLNLVLIPRYGMVGAAASTLVAYAALFAVTLVVGRRLMPLRYEWGRLARVAVLTGVLLWAGSLLPDRWQVAVPAKAALLALFWVVVLAGGVLGPQLPRSLAQRFSRLAVREA